MSWFKNTAGDNTTMSNSSFDLKSPLPPPPPRNEFRSSLDRTSLETKAALEAKPPLEAKSPLDIKQPVEAKSTVEVKSAVDAKAPAEAKATAVEARPVVSVFGASLRFKGELRADEDFTLQGRIEGSIHHTQNLTIGTDGFVKGDSRARNIIVDGTIEGDLYALESIAIRPTAKVQGNLMAPRVSIADGASFNGKVDMATAARAARSIADRVATAPAEAAVGLDDRAAEQVLLTGSGGG
jgi:cytoskeletal protein CcmA (bactofilin family)